MSNLDVFLSPDSPRGKRAKQSGSRGSKKKSLVGLLVTALVFVVIAAVAAPKIKSMLSGAPDFPGPGTGSVTIEVKSGDSLAIIGNTLKAQGVVASVDAFTQAAADNSESAGIQPGFYELKKEMKSSDAVDALIAGDSKQQNTLVIPEGKRATWIVAAAAKATGLSEKDLTASLAHADTLGLPDYAKGNPEGFLFPATYQFPPNATADDVITTLISKFNDVAKQEDLVGKAASVGKTPYEILTVASLVEVEAHPRDFAKVSRVVYNRLKAPMRLEFDSTVNYGLGKSDVILTQDQLDKDTPYNMYLHDGLPPTPIGNPGQAAIDAALNPEAGDWVYFITVDLDSQETKFTKSYSEFLKFKDQFLAWCDANNGKCW